jgi:hypothetical protein
MYPGVSGSPFIFSTHIIIMLSRSQVHIDTAVTSNIQSVAQITKLAGNPFQCTYQFGNTHRGLCSISLQNAQIPIGFYNVRAPFNTIVISGTTYTITPGNYTTLDALNAAIVTPGSVALSTLGRFAASSVTGIVTFTAAGGNKSLGPVTQNSLLSFLGYTQTTTTAVAATLTGTYPYTLNWDTYIIIWIENIGQSSMEPVQITFKLPLSSLTNNVLYWSESSQNNQYMQVFNKNTRIDRLNIVFLDRFGNILNNNGIDWSMSFDIESSN